MVDFAVGRGIELPDDTLKAIVEADAALAAGGLDDERARAAISAAQRVARAIQPVTIEGMRYCTPDADGKSPATKLATWHRWLAITSFLILIISQFYWVLLTESLDRLQDTQREIGKYGIVIDNITNELVKTLGRHPSDSEIVAAEMPFYSAQERKQKEALDKSMSDNPAEQMPASISDRIYMTKARLFTLESAQSYSLGMLCKLELSTSNVCAANLQPNNNLPDVKDYEVVLDSARFVLEIMNKYLLPIMYGLLGASIYIVRRIVVGIRDGLLTERDRTDFSVRFFLGGFSGLAVSWFLTPSSSQPTASTGATLAGLSGLSPLVISFLAGYGIEIVFSTVDKIISGFRDSDTSSQTTRS
jgi:hypothetical protein